MMPRALKVWLFQLHVWEAVPAPNGGRQRPAVVATTSWKKAAELYGVTVYELRKYGWICPKGEYITQAMTEPGTVFWIDERGDKEWHRLKND